MTVFHLVIILLITYGIIACGMTLIAPLTEFISGLCILFSEPDTRNPASLFFQSKGYYLVSVLGNAISFYKSPFGIHIKSSDELTWSRKECHYYDKHFHLSNKDPKLSRKIGEELVFNGIWFVGTYIIVFILLTLFNYNSVFHGFITYIISLI